MNVRLKSLLDNIKDYEALHATVFCVATYVKDLNALEDDCFLDDAGYEAHCITRDEYATNLVFAAAALRHGDGPWAIRYCAQQIGQEAAERAVADALALYEVFPKTWEDFWALVSEIEVEAPEEGASDKNVFADTL